jgi:predicted glycosyltransferase involved in capsule biosynthesis
MQLPVYTGDSEGERWERARAVNNAVAQAGDADVLLISDSDILLERPVAQTLRACELALEKNAYVVAFTTLLYLNQEGSEDIRAGGSILPPEHVFWEQSNIWGGVFAIPRSLWDQVGGFDERFQGYGSEDKGFLVCASTLGGDKQRIPGHAYHLDHPEDETKGSAVTATGNLLAGRYLAADGNRDAILSILAER